MARTEHDLDIYAWAHENAELLRQGKFNEVDMVNVIPGEKSVSWYFIHEALTQSMAHTYVKFL